MKYQIIPPENAGYNVSFTDTTCCIYENDTNIKGNNLVDVLAEFLHNMQPPETSSLKKLKEKLQKNQNSGEKFTVGEGFSTFTVQLWDDRALVNTDRGDIQWGFSKINLELVKPKEYGEYKPVSLHVSNMDNFGIDLDGDTIEIPIEYQINNKKFKFTSLEAREIFIDFQPDSVFLGCFENSNIKFINVPENITEIGPRCFANCRNLQSVTLNNVESIGFNAFENCRNLTNINLSETLKSIYSEAFKNCTSLTSITIPKSVIGIDRNAFANCENLTNVIWNSDIPLTEELIKDVFVNCPKLKEIITKDGKIELDKIIKNTNDPSR